jgi:uncharacterized protein (TIRG00374 family)
MRRKLWLQLIGILIFVIILWKLDLTAIYALIVDADPILLILSLLLVVPFVLLKSLRWKYLLKMQGFDYDFKNCSLAYLSSMYLGLVTPGRIGDFAKVLYLKKDGNIPISKGLSSVVVDRLFDLLILLCMAFTGVIALALSWNILVIILFFLLLFFAIIFIFTNEFVGKTIINVLYKIILPKKSKESAEVRFSTFYESIGRLKSVKLIYPLIYSVLSYAFFYAQCYLIARALGIPISILNVAFCISTANLVSLLPISISGIGTRDATLISIFSVLNLSKEAAVAFSIMFLFISNFATCLIGVVAWFKKPVDTKT